MGVILLQMLSREHMIDICRTGNASYDGIFFMAVRSTNIYCLPSCPARFPLEHNIEFYETRKEAEQAGYRGCLRCYSAEYSYQPPWLTDLVEFLHNHLEKKLTMSDLERFTQRHRSTVSAHFTQQYGMTAMDYFRRLKMDTARNRILEGEDYRDVAFSLGYSSISGFRSAFKRCFSHTPGQIGLEVNQ